MKWQRYIIHADLNHCYAQIEEMMRPKLKDIPMAVGGDEKKRHGIILAKNDLAKAYGIKTGESLREAYKKCPHLLVISAHYDEYIYYTEQVKRIYREYTDRVESFGLDEAWLDISECTHLYGDPIKLAKHIQDRVYDEMGLTVSMGISFNKVFAKLGSDIDKHRGFVVIAPDEYKAKIYDRPVEDLLYVGRATKEKLNRKGIFTIGELAHLPSGYLRSLLGKNGQMISDFARGKDTSEVKKCDQSQDAKSISNGITTIRDLKTIDDVKMIFHVLAESVASRLKESSLEGDVIYIVIRDFELRSFSRQRKLMGKTDLACEIYTWALSLFKESVAIDQRGELVISLRSVTIGVSGLKKRASYIEYDLFETTKNKLKERDLEVAIDTIRNKYGHDKAVRLVTKLDRELTAFDPKSEHVIYPESWF